MTMLRFPVNQRVGDRLYRRSDGTLSYFFSKEALLQLAGQAGFSVVSPGLNIEFLHSFSLLDSNTQLHYLTDNFSVPLLPDLSLLSSNRSSSESRRRRVLRTSGQCADSRFAVSGGRFLHC